MIIIIPYHKVQFYQIICLLNLCSKLLVHFSSRSNLPNYVTNSASERVLLYQLKILGNKSCMKLHSCQNYNVNTFCFIHFGNKLCFTKLNYVPHYIQCMIQCDRKHRSSFKPGSNCTLMGVQSSYIWAACINCFTHVLEIEKQAYKIRLCLKQLLSFRQMHVY